MNPAHPPSSSSTQTLGFEPPAYSIDAPLVASGNFLLQVPSTNQSETIVDDHEKARLQRRGRKGHSKSRRGCYNCKKARIKCKENRPSCDYCSHRGLNCEWPDIQMICQVPQAKPKTKFGTIIRNATPVSVPVALQAEMPVFTMQDFRLFNHFIQTAYPHHPVGNDSVWTHEIPSLASDYDFLLHSMLALAAQDLANTTPPSKELTRTALTYRVKAITSFNQAITQGSVSLEMSNAMIGACFSLLFQSVMIEDGLIEYMTFIRGVIAVAIHMGENGINFLFKNMFNQTEIVQSELKDAQLIDPDLARAACRSLEKLGPLIKNSKEIEYFGHLLSAARALFTSSSDAYSNLAKIYGLFSYFMSHAEFATFVHPTNEAGKLLQSHFAALQLIMTPITLNSQGRRAATSPGRGTTAIWLTALHKRINPDFRDYYEWPMQIERGVAERTVPLKFEELTD